MAGASIDMVDVLCELLEGEHGCMLRFLGEAEPYISGAAVEAGRLLQGMVAAAVRREGELVNSVSDLGGTPRPPAVSREHQYLAYLSMDYLLPKLAEAKERSIARYESALQQIGESGPAVSQALKRHLAEHRGELEAITGLVGGVRR